MSQKKKAGIISISEVIAVESNANNNPKHNNGSDEDGAGQLRKLILF